jgi:hypothetical protein
MRRNQKISIVMFLVGMLFIYLLYFTNAADYIAPKAEYVRLKNGKEFRDVPMRWPNRVDVIIDGQRYNQYDIDSLVR